MVNTQAFLAIFSVADVDHDDKQLPLLSSSSSVELTLTSLAVAVWQALLKQLL